MLNTEYELRIASQHLALVFEDDPFTTTFVKDRSKRLEYLPQLTYYFALSMYKNGFCFAFVESQNLMHMNAALLASPEGVEGNYWTEMNSIDKLYQKYFTNYERDKTVQV